MHQEIFSALTLSPESFDSTRINDTFDRLGPTARLCIELLSDLEDLEAYEHGVNEAISNVTSGQLEKLFRDALGLTMDVVSHKICLISRENRENVCSRAVVAPITNSMTCDSVPEPRSRRTNPPIQIFCRGPSFEEGSRRLLRISRSTNSSGWVYR
jgi:hypothetical protein